MGIFSKSELQQSEQKPTKPFPDKSKLYSSIYTLRAKFRPPKPETGSAEDQSTLVEDKQFLEKLGDNISNTHNFYNTRKRDSTGFVEQPVKSPDNPDDVIGFVDSTMRSHFTTASVDGEPHNPLANNVEDTPQSQGRNPNSVEAEGPYSRATRALSELYDRARPKLKEQLFVNTGILGDSDKIEGHQIDLISQGKKTVVTFKLTSAMSQRLEDEILPRMPKETVSTGGFQFESTTEETRSLGDCWIVRVDATTVIYISKGRREFPIPAYNHDKPIRDDYGNIIDFNYSKQTVSDDVRTLMGAVKIEVNGLTALQEIAEKIDTAFKKIMIPEALVPPDQKAENAYKEARYRWQHRLEDDHAWKAVRSQFRAVHGRELIDHLQRQEVFPNYFSIVEPGANARYQAQGKIFLTHTVIHDSSLISIFQHGLLSSHERYKRGIFNDGMSTDRDFETGGADNVFLRAVTEKVGNIDGSYSKANLVIDARVLDRTDWYAYNFDNYGTTTPEIFNIRPSPESFFYNLNQNYSHSNEIMMRRGIPPEMIIGVLVGSKISRMGMISRLHNQGIHHVRGVPIEQYIILGTGFDELSNNSGDAHPKPHRSASPTQRTASAFKLVR